MVACQALLAKTLLGGPGLQGASLILSASATELRQAVLDGVSGLRRRVPEPDPEVRRGSFIL